MPTILVVDDSQVDRRLVGGLLQRAGLFEVVYADSGPAALDAMELDMPDLVLTDLQMPEMNGLELVEEIKSGFPLVPVMLMTAVGSEELAVEALRRGAAGYVAKRRLAEELISSLEQVLDAAVLDRGQTRLMTRITRSETTYVLPNEASLIHALVQQIRGTLRSMRHFGENDRLRIGIALEESLLNAMYHGNLELSSDLRNGPDSTYEAQAKVRAKQEPWCRRTLSVDVQLTSEHALFVITDEGSGFLISSVPDPTDPEFLERPSGRGLLLMRSFMDDVIFNERGNQVTLLKRVPTDVVNDESAGDDDDDNDPSADA